MYDERFKEHLFDRIQQICELYVAGYSFHVLNTGFVIHRGLKLSNPEDTSDHYTADKFNWDLFNYHFKDELQRKYQTSRTCSPVKGESDEIIGPGENEVLSDRPENDDFKRYQIQRNLMGHPVAIPNDTPVLFEGISRNNRNPILPHDHLKGTVIVNPGGKSISDWTRDSIQIF